MCPVLRAGYSFCPACGYNALVAIDQVVGAGSERRRRGNCSHNAVNASGLGAGLLPEATKRGRWGITHRPLSSCPPCGSTVVVGATLFRVVDITLESANGSPASAMRLGGATFGNWGVALRRRGPARQPDLFSPLAHSRGAPGNEGVGDRRRVPKDRISERTRSCDNNVGTVFAIHEIRREPRCCGKPWRRGDCSQVFVRYLIVSARSARTCAERVRSTGASLDLRATRAELLRTRFIVR
jgi:hypothetical protein